MTFLVAGVLGVTAIIVAWIASQWAHRQAAIWRQGQADLQQFTTSAVALMRDKALPQSVAAFVARLSREAGRPRLAFWTVGKLLAGKLADPLPPPNNDEQRQFREDMDGLSVPQMRALAQCAAYCLMSSAAATGLFAPYLRAVIQFGLFEPATKRVSDSGKASTIVVEYSNRRAYREQRLAHVA